MAEAGSLADVRRALAGHERGERAIAEIERVIEFASVTAAAPHLSFDVSLARGLGYYTGCIFEIAVSDLAGSLGGGGRYDGLIGMFLGKDVPACGFSLGLERILVVMEERKMYPESFERTDAVVAPVDEADMKSALALCEQLRAAGLRIDLLPRAIAPGKLRKHADDHGLAAAIWLEPGQTDRASLWRKSDGATHKDLSSEQLGSLLASDR
jgi:histidyl-tRNA synthetase